MSSDSNSGFEASPDESPRTSGPAWGVGLLALLGGAIVVGMFVMRLNQVSAPGPLGQWVGKPAPRLTLVTHEGTTLDLADLQGKYVVLNFWATWCPPCRAELPDLQKFHEHYGSDDLVLIGVSDEPAETVKTFIDREGLTFLQATPRNVSGLFQEITGIPTTVVVDPDGNVAGVHTGIIGEQELAALTQR